MARQFQHSATGTGRLTKGSGGSPVAAGAFGPGLVLTFGIAAAAILVHRLSGLPALSPLVVAMVLGMLLRNTVGPIAAARPGITFSLKRILRFAIVLLGFQLTLMQVVAVGGRGLVVIVATLVLTFAFTTWVGRLLRVDRKLTELIAAGTSVCGASAVIATNTVTRGADEDVAYAIACVTVFGSLSMLLFPAVGHVLHMSAGTYGVWVGATIHEVAQVVAAAFQGGEVAGQTGTVAKLSRVILLAPLILVLASLATRRGVTPAEGRAPTPWFVFGFIGVVIVNSFVQLPPTLHGAVVQATAFLLTVALAAMGLETSFGKLRRKGIRPLLLGAAAWLFVSVTGFTLVALL